MRRTLCILLCFLLLLTAAGCRNSSTGTLSFYYCRNDFTYGSESGVIAAEKRDASGHENELSYLLSLYLVGPLDEALYSPFPSQTRLISAEVIDKTAVITLSELPESMTEPEITLAFGCLTLTCQDITGAEQVTITSGGRTVTMDRDSLLLYDDVTAIPTVEETQ